MSTNGYKIYRWLERSDSILLKGAGKKTDDYFDQHQIFKNQLDVCIFFQMVSTYNVNMTFTVKINTKTHLTVGPFLLM